MCENIPIYICILFLQNNCAITSDIELKNKFMNFTANQKRNTKTKRTVAQYIVAYQFLSTDSGKFIELSIRNLWHEAPTTKSMARYFFTLQKNTHNYHFYEQDFCHALFFISIVLKYRIIYGFSFPFFF